MSHINGDSTHGTKNERRSAQSQEESNYYDDWGLKQIQSIVEKHGQALRSQEGADVFHDNQFAKNEA
jgi:hypothetical protein